MNAAPNFVLAVTRNTLMRIVRASGFSCSHFILTKKGFDVMNSKKVLECSSKGDRKFSALYAKVSVFGVQDSIENHYQKSKRDSNGNPVKKGMPVAYMVINNQRFPPGMLTDWYRLLWVKYLDKNPELVSYARQFDEFTDMFRSRKTINCQADVVRDYLADRNELVRSADALVKELRKMTVA